MIKNCPICDQQLDCFPFPGPDDISEEDIRDNLGAHFWRAHNELARMIGDRRIQNEMQWKVSTVGQAVLDTIAADQLQEYQLLVAMREVST